MPAPEPEPATPPPTQVIDLATTKPEDALRRFAAVDGLRVLVCGGGAACSKLASNSRGTDPSRRPTICSRLPFAPERGALVAWMPRRGCGGALVPA
eukprot:scaffold118722_cov60-Phaeocystis_antarctica.AAC.8